VSSRRLVATRRKLPVSVTRVLTGDRNRVVRRNLSWNHDCDAEILRVLSQDEDSKVREAVAKSLG
jgi:hypothetical protein